MRGIVNFLEILVIGGRERKKEKKRKSKGEGVKESKKEETATQDEVGMRKTGRKGKKGKG